MIFKFSIGALILAVSTVALVAATESYRIAKSAERSICLRMYFRSVKLAKSEPDCLPYVEQWIAEDAE